MFRFEQGQAVEHWDNIQHRLGPNSSAHSMIDGPTEATDHAQTEANRELIRSFVTAVLIEGKHAALVEYFDQSCYVEHNPQLSDDLATLHSALSSKHGNTSKRIDYQKNNRVLAEGNFVLSICEGSLEGVAAAFYDLFRLHYGKIVEHWDTTEKIAPLSEWKNHNGKF